jgi:hypothetical protein
MEVPIYFPTATSTSRLPTLIAIAFIATIAFFYRYLTLEFTNDHFVHLSRAFQIVEGEVPLRDFFDPGLILQYYASAATLWWFGHNLFGEALLTAGFIALGSVLTFLAAKWLSRSSTIAVVVTMIGILAMPRLYSYPKVVFYVLAVVVAWGYVHRPGRLWAAALALTTTVAFLFRYDHGVYISLAIAVLLLVRHWPRLQDVGMSMVTYGLITLLLMSPFLIFLQSTVGIIQQVGNISPQVGGATTVRVNLMGFEFDRTAPFITQIAPSGPRVNVRWASDLTDEARESLERKHELLSPEHVEESTWSYVLPHEDREYLAKLIDDPAVADTHGLDRAGRKLEVATPAYVRLQHAWPIVRLRIASGVFNNANALAWFYYSAFFLPLIAAAILARQMWSGSISREEAAVVAMAIVLCAIIVQTLVRGSPDSRLGDIANPLAVLGAWVVAQCLARAAQAKPPVPVLVRAAMVAIAIVSAWSVGTNANGMTSLVMSGVLSGPAGIRERLAIVSQRLRARPVDNWTRRSPGIGGLTRYAYECTAVSDHLFVTWFAPQVYFQSERPFSGGQVFLAQGWHATPADQQVSVALLQRQRVPIILENMDWEYEHYFPIVAEYIRSHYRNVEIPADWAQGYRVLVDPRVKPTGTYDLFDMPCYR